MSESLPREIRDMVLSLIVLKRFGTLQDVAELATVRAGYITGQVIPVDGGFG